MKRILKGWALAGAVAVGRLSGASLAQAGPSPAPPLPPYGLQPPGWGGQPAGPPSAPGFAPPAPNWPVNQGPNFNIPAPAPYPPPNYNPVVGGSQGTTVYQNPQTGQWQSHHQSNNVLRSYFDPGRNTMIPGTGQSYQYTDPYGRQVTGNTWIGQDGRPHGDHSVTSTDAQDNTNTTTKYHRSHDLRYLAPQ